MSELQQSRYDRLLRRVGNMIGAGSMVNEALSELFPIIDVEGYQGELQLIKGSILAMGGGSATASAAERMKFQLFNPTDSGMLITCTRILFSLNATGSTTISTARIPLSAAVTAAEVVRDVRNPPNMIPVGEIFRESSGASVPANLTIRSLTDRPVDIRDENGLFVLPPGTGVSVGAGEVQTTFHCNFFWRERVAEASELNF